MPRSRPKQRAPANWLGRLFLQAGPTLPGIPFWVLIAPILGFVLVISFCEITSLDVWWHLKTGEWILQHKTVPQLDPFSFSAEGRPWIAHEWLFGLVVFLVQKAAGMNGLIILKAFLMAALFALSAWTARARAATPGMTALVLAACYEVARLRFSERPELFSLPMAVAFLLVYEKSSQRRALLLLLPCLQLVWVNVHGGTALLGWALTGAFLLDMAWQLRMSGSSWPRLRRARDFQWCLGALAAVVAISFASPNPYRNLAYGLLRAESPLNIQEFQSLPEAVALGPSFSAMLFLAFALLLATLFFVQPRRVKMYEWLLFPLLLALAVYFFRFRSLFVFLLAPTLASLLSQGKIFGRIRWWLPGVASLALFIHIAATESNSYAYRFGAGVHAGVLPVAATEFVRENRLSGRMFNSYGLGGYLIWNLFPDLRVFIDGREDVYVQPGVAAEYMGAFRSGQNWRDLVNRHGIDLAMLDYPEEPPASPEMSLEQLAFPRSEWALVYFDDVSVIYLRRISRFEEVIRNHEIRFVQPLQLSAYLDPILRDPEKLRLFLGEMEANLRLHPDSFRAHFLNGIVAIKRGRGFLEEAIREFQQTVALNPEYIAGYFNLGNIYLQLGRISEARRMFESILELSNNADAARQLDALRDAR